VPRVYCTEPLASDSTLNLPAGAARHVQVLRLQPGDALTLFDGGGGEYEARVSRMGRSDVEVQVGMHHALERENSVAVHLALGMPANERMDWLVEKATELGAASIQPLVGGAQRAAAGRRAARRRSRRTGRASPSPPASNAGATVCPLCIRAITGGVGRDAAAAGWSCPQPGRSAFVGSSRRRGSAPAQRPGRRPHRGGRRGRIRAWLAAVRLGARVLRAETAPLAALAVLTLSGSHA
jgi:16S rRNA (uracil1498-N3)-methyltransferase